MDYRRLHKASFEFPAIATRTDDMVMTRIGIDLAVSVFQIHDIDEDGVVVRKERNRLNDWKHQGWALRIESYTVALYSAF